MRLQHFGGCTAASTQRTHPPHTHTRAREHSTTRSGRTRMITVCLLPRERGEMALLLRVVTDRGGETIDLPVRATIV